MKKRRCKWALKKMNDGTRKKIHISVATKEEGQKNLYHCPGEVDGKKCDVLVVPVFCVNSDSNHFRAKSAHVPGCVYDHQNRTRRVTIDDGGAGFDRNTFSMRITATPPEINRRIVGGGEEHEKENADEEEHKVERDDEIVEASARNLRELANICLLYADDEFYGENEIGSLILRPENIEMYYDGRLRSRMFMVLMERGGVPRAVSEQENPTCFGRVCGTNSRRIYICLHCSDKHKKELMDALGIGSKDDKERYIVWGGDWQRYVINDIVYLTCNITNPKRQVIKANDLENYK